MGASRNKYYQDIASSMVVLCLPGLGYDTYRLSEALAMGTMAVIERGIGFDRSLYRLPALLVDDFADLTLHMIQQAYVEVMYRADEWEYERISYTWWSKLLHEVSNAGNDEALQRLHPYSVHDATFTRPLIPFNCEKIGGCGPGTKRVPKKSCAIDLDMDMSSYASWYWAVR